MGIFFFSNRLFLQLESLRIGKKLYNNKLKINLCKIIYMYIKRSLRHYTYYIIWEYLKEGRKYIK